MGRVVASSPGISICENTYRSLDSHPNRTLKDRTVNQIIYATGYLCIIDGQRKGPSIIDGRQVGKGVPVKHPNSQREEARKTACAETGKQQPGHALGSEYTPSTGARRGQELLTSVQGEGIEGRPTRLSVTFMNTGASTVASDFVHRKVLKRGPVQECPVLF